MSSPAACSTFDWLPSSIQAIIVGYLDGCCEDADNPIFLERPKLLELWKQNVQYRVVEEHIPPGTSSDDPEIEETTYWNGWLHRVVTYLVPNSGQKLCWFKRWRNRAGQTHRDHDLPAVISFDLHYLRDYFKPPIVSRVDCQAWFRNGRLHRDNSSPAVVQDNGRREWWTDGFCTRVSATKNGNRRSLSQTQCLVDWYDPTSATRPPPLCTVCRAPLQVNYLCRCQQ